jgi:hypothetical protein
MTVQYQGVWSLQSAAQLQSTQRWVTDPLYKNTTLLLQADDAANGAQNNTFLDSSSNSFAITRNGGNPGMTQGTFSPFSQSPGWWGVNFNRGYLSSTLTGQAAGTGSFTYEMYFFISLRDAPINNVAALFNTRGSGSGADGIDCQITSTGQVQVGTSGLILFTSGAGLVADNTWYHLAIVRNGSTNCTVYLNGLSIGTFSAATNYSSTNLYLGVFGGLNDWFKGYISNFRYTRDAVYTANFIVSTTPLTALPNTQFLTARSNRYVDDSANGFTVTPVVANGGTSVQAFSPFAPQFQWTPSVIGGSGYFDGTGDYLSVASNTALTFGTGDFTVEGWFYANSIPTQPTILNNGSDAAGLVITMVSSKIYAYFVGAGNVFGSGGATIVPNTWYHFAWVRSGSTHTFYLNGAVYGATYSSAGNHSSTGGVGIGYSVAGTVFNAWNGYIANVRMVKGTAVYSGAFTPPIAPVTTSGPASSYSSTTNVNTTFTSTNTSLLTNFTNAGIVDGTMKNNLETVGNAQVSTAVVKYGSGSMFFDGTGDYLRIPTSQTNSLGSGSWTIEFWVYRVGSGNQIFYDQRSTATQVAVTIFNDGNNILRFFVNGANQISDTGTFPASTWTHVAVSKFNSSTRMFVNGVQVGSTYADTNTYVNNPIFVGAQFDGSGTLNGYIDDLRVTLGIARYTQNFIPPSVALPRQ